MGGTLYLYHCERCPLFFELGGHVWEEKGGRLAEWKQFICAGCGTLHRFTLRHGECDVVAMPGPVRESSDVTVRTGLGDVYDITVYVRETDWRPAGRLSGGFAAVGEFPCSHCGRSGRLLGLEQLLYPDGYSPGAVRQELCPVCRGPTEAIGVSDMT